MIIKICQERFLSQIQASQRNCEERHKTIKKSVTNSIYIDEFCYKIVINMYKYVRNKYPVISSDIVKYKYLENMYLY